MVLRLPSCLFGSTRDTRAMWKRFIRHAWKDGWNHVLQALELSVLRDADGPIILLNDALPWITNDDYWHLCWVAEVFPATIESLQRHPERHFHFVLEGMQHNWWYALSVSARTAMHFPFARMNWVWRPSGGIPEVVYRPMLRWFVHWLPEIVGVLPRLAFAYGRVGPAVYSDCQIVQFMFDCMLFTGYVDLNARNHLMASRPKDLLSHLRRLRVIQPDDARFRLIE